MASMARRFQFHLRLLFYLTAVAVIVSLIANAFMESRQPFAWDSCLFIALLMASGIAETWPRK
jgi:hypothetical protein